MKIEFNYSGRLKRSIKIRQSFRTLYVSLPSFFKEIPESDFDRLYFYLSEKYIKKQAVKKDIIKDLFENYMDKGDKIVKRKYYSDNHFHDLRRYFDELNEKYFENCLELRDIGWSYRKSQRLLGKWCQETNTIIISSIFNRKKIKLNDLKFIIYHEMCHMAFPPYLKGGRRYVHHKAFKRKEREYGQ